MGKLLFKLFGGIDPDLHSTGLAFIKEDEDGKLSLYYVDCIKAKGKINQDAVVKMAKAIREHFLYNPGVPTAHVQCFAVEAQEIYLGKTKNPRAIMWLANAAGCALQEASAQYDTALIKFPKPSEWKGQVPKHVCQNRAFSELGIGIKQIKGTITKNSAYCVPELKGLDCHIGDLNQGDWKHVGDAVALALWARNEYNQIIRTQELRKNRV